jgi:short-subunit dehydrogenase
MPPSVLITGASRGIGRALALHYAREGSQLALIGRDDARLEAVAGECRKLGVGVSLNALDVRNRTEMASRITALDDVTPIDLVIANAGTMAGTPARGTVEPADAAHAVIETSILGVLNTVQPLLTTMIARRRGQIAIVSSIAGFIPLPDSPSYCASKAAVLNYGLSLRTLLASYGIAVSVVCPGYVTTPMMSRESGAKPFAMSPERAARLIVKGLDRNRAVIAFPYLGLSQSCPLTLSQCEGLRNTSSGKFDALAVCRPGSCWPGGRTNSVS